MIQILQKEDLATSTMIRVFDNTATSYKYFWFLSILQLYKENRQTTLTFERLSVRMISNAWQYLFEKGGAFPKTDQIPKYIEEIKERTPLGRFSYSKYVDDFVLEYYKKAKLSHWLLPLIKNVPYRFLSLWIPFMSNEDVVAKSNNPETRCPYSLHDDHIEINTAWGDYLMANYEKIAMFVEQELCVYLKIKKQFSK